MGDQYVRIIPNDELSYKRPQHVYEGQEQCPLYSSPDKRVTCQLTSNVNETGLWCEECGETRGLWVRLAKCFQGMGIRMATVWHDTDQINLTTGRVETDAKKFKTYLAEQSEIMGERLGMKVDYQPTDPTDRDALGVTDEGLDATHDHQVRTGQKDSRGRFVF